MPHIHTKPGQHDHTASGFIIRTDFNEPKAMLHWHKKLNTWLQFGGHIELHETPWQAVAHELEEESGYTLNQLQILQPKQRITKVDSATIHPIPCCFNTHDFDGTGNHFHTDHMYAFITDQEPSLPLAANESDEIKLFTREELQNLETKEVFENVKDIGLFIFDEILPNWEVVDTNTFTL
jgi:8-oxo-dGTP pyrophosphatase MutT (NUDIX family)